MDRGRLDGMDDLRGTIVTLLMLMVGAALTWGLLQSFGSTTGVRHAPAQSPAGQEPMQRGTPSYDQDLMS